MKCEMEIMCGILCVLAALSIGGSIIGLVFKFGYPKIIRKDAVTILEKLNKEKKTVPYLYYLFGIGGFLLVYASISLSNLELKFGESTFSKYGEVSGIIYGVLLFAGILRYTKLFPLISDYMVNNKITKDEAACLFNTFNSYVGETVTEHVAFVFLAAMILFNSISLLAVSYLPAWIGISGIVVSIGMFIGNLEFLGFKKLFAVNRIFSSLSAVWLLILGIIVLF